MIRLIEKILIPLLFCGGAWPAWAALGPSDMKVLKDILNRYQKSALVEIDLEKKVTSELLGREKVHQGKALLAPKRFRLETVAPEKSLIVYDGDTLWNIQYPSDGESSAIQVIKAKLDAKTQNQILLGDLLVGQGLLNKFDFTGVSRNGDEMVVSAKPKKSQVPVKDLRFHLALKEKLIRSIEYTDDLGNKIVMSLSGTQFKRKKNAKLFQYKPEKGAQVTDL